MHRYLAVVAFTLGCVWLSYLIPALEHFHGFIAMLGGFAAAIAAFVLERKQVGRMGMGSGALIFNGILFITSIPALWFLAKVYDPSAVDFISVGFVVVMWGVSMCVVIAIASRRG